MLLAFAAIALTQCGPDGPVYSCPSTTQRGDGTWNALDGHSILAGYNSTFLITSGVQALTGHTTPPSFAVPGSRTSECVDRFNARILGRGYGVLDWQCAVNDIGFDHDDPFVVEQAAEVAWNAATAAGMYVIVNDELPCGDAGAAVGGACFGVGPANLFAYNAYSNFWCRTHGTTARCLTDYNTFSDGGIALDPQYASSDWLHLNDAGAGLLTQLIANAIDAGPQGAESGGVLIDLGAAGLGAACACADITTNDGGAITYTRSGTAYCSTLGTWKTTGIANGGVPACAANKPRVEPGYDGGISLLVEPPVANTTTFPTNLAGADWSTQGVVVAAPTVTANATTDPFGNVAATRLDLAATSSSAQGSLVYNLTGCPGGAHQTQSLYVKGVSTSGIIDMCAYDVGASSATCVDCAFVSATWTRCGRIDFSNTPGVGYFLIGNANYYSGSGVGRPAQSIYVQGASCTDERNLTSFPGTSRAAEMATTPMTLSATLISGAATYDAVATLAGNETLFEARKDSDNYSLLYSTAAGLRANFQVGGSSNTVTSNGGQIVAGAGNHGWMAYAGSTYWVNSNGTVNAAYGALTLGSGAGTVYLGGAADGGQVAHGWLRDVKVCNNAGSCR